MSLSLIPPRLTLTSSSVQEVAAVGGPLDVLTWVQEQIAPFHAPMHSGACRRRPVPRAVTLPRPLQHPQVPPISRHACGPG
jgi:hypothetical protein